ncbi:MAG: DUF4062 domain-containing protein [Bacteroidota bacterium]
MADKTIRLFVSSTFDDFRREREVLQTYIFPRIKKYSRERGYYFQPIDLRWGISQEAQLNQKTLELCLNEVRTCKSYAGPNFLGMIGDRYGWVPLPYAIEKKEFEQLLHHLSKKEQEPLTDWYQEDLNQVPTAYLLRERQEDFAAADKWFRIEEALRTSVQKAATAADLTQEQRAKYFTSATESEFQEGILAFGSPTPRQQLLLKHRPQLRETDWKQSFIFIRNVEQGSKQSDRFIGSDYDDAQQLKEKVRAVAPSESLQEGFTFEEDPAQLNRDYLIGFAESVIQFLEHSIEAQIQREQEAPHSALEQERQAQEEFRVQKAQHFVGRSVPLQEIAQYISNPANDQALILYGRSGIGKSSIMAQAIKNARGGTHRIIFRFIGATPTSVYSKDLLKSVFDELGIDIKRDMLTERLQKMDPNHLPESMYGRLPLAELSERLDGRFKEIKERVVLFFDAVDQLADDDPFEWLPERLPPNLKIIISVRAEEDASLATMSQEDRQIKAEIKSVHLALHRKTRYGSPLYHLLRRSQRLQFIDDFESPTELLLRLLNSNNRRLQGHQEAYFLEQFQTARTPLYVYVAAQEIKNWKSFDPVGTTAVSSNSWTLAKTQSELISVYIQNLTTLRHHHNLLVQRALGYLCVTEDGLSEHEMLELLSADEELIALVAPDTWHENLSKKVPQVIWTRLLDDLRPFLSQKQRFGTVLLNFFHQDFRESVITNETQRSEHEQLIKAVQDILLRQSSSFGVYRCEELYIYLITQYDLKYQDKLEAYSVWIPNNFSDDHWLEYRYFNTIFFQARDFNSAKQDELAYKHTYLLSTAFTTEVLYQQRPEVWNIKHLDVLEELTEVYRQLRDQEAMQDIATIALKTLAPWREKEPETYTKYFFNFRLAIAWSYHGRDREECLRQYKELRAELLQLYRTDPDQWSGKYLQCVRTLAVIYRGYDQEKALRFYEEAVDIAERQFKNSPHKWQRLYDKCQSEYQSFYRYELSLLEKAKFGLKKRFR